MRRWSSGAVRLSQSTLIAVVGPTGSGKSSLAEYLAARLNGELVSCDSVQIYRGFNIGTAKTPAHLVDIAAPDEVFTAGEYARCARIVIAEIISRARLPVIVGGTGFYLRALFHGLFPGPQRDEPLRARLAIRQQRRPGSLHRILARFDPASAARIHPNDVNKTIRALEVRLVTQRPLSEMFEEGRNLLPGFRILKIGLNPPRQALYARLNERFLQMLSRGLLEEVRDLLEAGVSPGAKPFESLGYKQALAVVRGDVPLDAAVAEAQMETRRYAKRQMSWFRADAEITWFDGFGDAPLMQAEVFEFVQGALPVSASS